MSDREPPVWELLRKLGARKREDYFILDELDSEFYIKFDAAIDTDRPGISSRTVDIILMKVGSHPKESKDGFRVMADCREMHVLRFLFALGVSRFSEKTRKAMYDSVSVIRTEDTHEKGRDHDQ